jgi:Fe(3+) dicitrate transport protein
MGLPSFPATSLLLVVASATATATVAAAVPPGADDGLEVVTIIARPADPLAVPGSSFVLTEADLKKIAHTDIHRMLQAVPGVYVKDEEGLGLFPNVGIRGASSARSAKITILEDGLPAAMAPYAAPASYVFPTAARMSGIEVLKGPGTLRHGPFTVGGTINLISTRIPEQFGGRLDVETGSFGSRQATSCSSRSARSAGRAPPMRPSNRASS